MKIVDSGGNDTTDEVRRVMGPDEFDKKMTELNLEDLGGDGVTCSSSAM